MPETTSVSRSGAFRAVGPAGFLDQIRVPRYAERTDLFDEIIAETHRHFWDPLDTAYIRFDEPFDMATETVMPASIVPELNSAVADRLTAQQRVWFANESARWWLSSRACLIAVVTQMTAQHSSEEWEGACRQSFLVSAVLWSHR